MAILDGIKRQLRSVIEWRDPDANELFHQWTDNGDEIKNASKLVVGPGQGCIFVYQGKVQAVIENECLTSLKTTNIPFWTTIKKIMQFFESEHKVGIYFFKRSKILNQKWGTTSVIKYEDPKYKFPVGLKVFGNYSYKISDPRSFFVSVVGSHNNFYIDDFRQVMSARILHPLTDYLAESKFSYTDIDANREEIASGMAQKLGQDFQKLGFEYTDFRIEGTSFDSETMTRINRIADLTAEAHAAKAVGLDYAKVQQLEAMREAARNEGGGAGMGMGLGAGIGLGQTMVKSMNDNPDNSVTTKLSPTEKLSRLKKMHTAELITDDEYSSKKKEILDIF